MKTKTKRTGTMSLLLLCMTTINNYLAAVECPIKNFDEVTVFCTDAYETGITYKANTNEEYINWFINNTTKDMGNYSYYKGEIVSCLEFTIEAPKWLIMKIKEDGDLTLNIKHDNDGDVDFACWGPFFGENKNEVLENICNNPLESFTIEPQFRQYNQDELNKCPDISNHWGCNPEYLTNTDNPCYRGLFDNYPNKNLIDCSFSFHSEEACVIPSAKEGEWYIFLISNCLLTPGNIIIQKESGTASIDCTPIIDVSNTGPYCIGDTIQLKVLNSPPNANYFWRGPNGFVSTEKNPIIPFATLSHNGEYSLSTICNGIATDEVITKVVVYPQGEMDCGHWVKISGIDPYCFGDTIQLNITKSPENATFLWEGPNEFSSSLKNPSIPFATERNMGQYSLTATIYDSIIDKILFDIVVHPQNHKECDPLVVIADNAPYCYGDTVKLMVLKSPKNATFSWEGPDNFSSSLKNPSIPFATYKNAGQYSLTATSNGIVLDTISSEVIIYPIDYDECDPLIKINNTGPYCYEESIQLNVLRAPNGSSFQWSDPDNFSSTERTPTIPHATEENSGEYSLVTTYKGIVLDKLTTEVVVYPLGHEGCNMIKPSKFLTPNGDNKNDRWIIENIEIYETVMVTIYDRYGKLVRYYDSYSNESGWDGYDYKNTKKPSDDYWYIINIPELDEVVSGHFSLIRK